MFDLRCKSKQIIDMRIKKKGTQLWIPLFTMLNNKPNLHYVLFNNITTSKHNTHYHIKTITFTF